MGIRGFLPRDCTEGLHLCVFRSREGSAPRAEAAPQQVPQKLIWCWTGQEMMDL